MKKTIILGGHAYEVSELPLKKAKAWRKALAEPFGEIVAALEAAGGLTVDNLSEVGRLVSTMSDALIGSVDTLVELLFDYAPELEADRERIEESATTSEAVAAFVEVLKLAYPLSVVAGLVNGAARK